MLVRPAMRHGEVASGAVSSQGWPLCAELGAVCGQQGMAITWPHGAAWRSIVLYALCSSVMLVINKVTISRVPLPGVVFCIQFLTTFLAIVVGKRTGHLEVDDLKAHTVLRFSPYAAAFVASVFLNGKVLQNSNVETLITFRACSPLFVSVLDWAFLGRMFPAPRSLIALVGVSIGAVGYVLCDSEFKMRGAAAYGWVSAYLVVTLGRMRGGSSSWGVSSGVREGGGEEGPEARMPLGGSPGVLQGEIDQAGPTSGAGVVRHLGRRWPLIARIFTRAGASCADVSREADLGGPEPVCRIGPHP